MVRIKKGLDLPIAGLPEQSQIDEVRVTRVAVLGGDYVGMKPTMAVKEGDRVKLGQVLFEDKKSPGVKYTSPGAGLVTVINRGNKRILESVEVSLEGDDAVTFDSYKPDDIQNLKGEQVIKTLVESGLWTALRTRPFSRVPRLDTSPNSIFVTAMDTQPLAANPEPVINKEANAFKAGLGVLKHLTEGKVFLCKQPEAVLPVVEGVETADFSGPHPAGLPGTHIHYLDPVNITKQVWFINYQDVISYGYLFLEGRIYTDRVISLAGPQVTKPRLLRTRIGASIEELTKGQLEEGENRLISGSVLSGDTAQGKKLYLGRYHQQISVVREGRERGFLEYLSPGTNKHSITRIYLSALDAAKRFSFTTTTNGSARAMVPIGNYEKIMPLDLLPTQLLRSLIVQDTDAAIELGCLELDEEDLALCTYVCPGKYEYGPMLRENLAIIEKEG